MPCSPLTVPPKFLTKVNNALNDLIISWELLKHQGVFAIDDYEWDYEYIGEFYKPKKAINYFLEQYKTEYTILSIQYIVFLYKK